MHAIMRLCILMGRVCRLLTTRPLHRSKRFIQFAKEYVAFHGGWRRSSRRVFWQGWGLLRSLGPRGLLRRLLTLNASQSIRQFEKHREEQAQKQSEVARLESRLLISLVVPVYRIPPHFLEECIRSVVEQYYQNWELILVDDCSQQPKLTELMKSWAARDSRIRCIELEQNVNISAATNAGIKAARGDFIGFVDHDDTLTPDALLEIVKRLDERPDTDIVYSDSDKIDPFGNRFEPFHKPDWSPLYFRSVMYVGHLLVVRRQLLHEVGGCDSTFDGVQDFELMLRLSEATNRIEHVPQILYHWRTVPGSLAHAESAKPRISELQQQAVQKQLDRLNIPGEALRTKSAHRVQVVPKSRTRHPLISIMIPTRDRPELIGPCLESIFERTTYPNFEVLLGDNETMNLRALAIFKEFPIRRIDLPGRFHFAAFNNTLARQAQGEYLLMLNNDTEVTQADWLDHLLFYAEQPQSGAVGPMLIYKDGSVQHAGVILGPRGTADHAMRNFPAHADGHAGSLQAVREVSAVTAACLLVDRDKFELCGGLNERFQRHYEDVDFCLQLSQRGWTNLYVGSVQLAHYESKTRGKYYDYTDRLLLLDRWEHRIDQGDPYYNPNFNINRVDYSLRAA